VTIETQSTKAILVSVPAGADFEVRSGITDGIKRGLWCDRANCRRIDTMFSWKSGLIPTAGRTLTANQTPTVGSSALSIFQISSACPSSRFTSESRAFPHSDSIVTDFFTQTDSMPSTDQLLRSVSKTRSAEGPRSQVANASPQFKSSDGLFKAYHSLPSSSFSSSPELNGRSAFKARVTFSSDDRFQRFKPEFSITTGLWFLSFHHLWLS
jgi:hypothetical protein